MRKITERGKSVGLLEPEESNDVPRLQRQAETADIPDSVLEETANADAGESFLRARQRVPVRRRAGSRFVSRFGWKNRWLRLAAVLIAVTSLGLLAAATWQMKFWLLHNPHFFLASSQNIQVTGNRVVSPGEVLALFAPDIRHSIFHVPLAKRQAELEQIRWVRRAIVMRFWPNRLRVSVVERMPVAFAREGNTVQLVDDEGVLLDLPAAAAQHYSFPVLSGISSSDPLSTRAARIQMYRQFVHALDADGGHISATLSEVDLSDPEDTRAVFTGGARQPLVHFGDADFLPRFRAYQAHLTDWLQQYPQLHSVDMRYGKQVVLDTGTGTPPAAPSAMTETAAVSAGEAAGTTPPQGTSVSKANAAKNKTKAESLKLAATAKHRATVHKHVRPRAPARGHRVRVPLMHVVSGM